MAEAFISEYYHTIDAKGRVIIPQKYRDELGNRFYLSKGLDGCLWITPESEWNKFLEKLRELSTINKKSRQFKRFFLAGATECELDKQGRILVTGPLRKYAELEKDVVLAGVDTRIELWNADKWETENAINDENMDDIAENLSDLGINI